MIDAPLALAFTAGMVATVNPCGFAMLPAYLGYFLGLNGAERTGGEDATAGLVRALVVGAVVSAGFLLLFAVVGLIVSWTSFSVGEVSPWLTVVIGAVLAVAGVGFVIGWSPTLMLPRLDKGGRDRGLLSMLVFGLSYAIASLSCTLPTFSGLVVGTFTRTSFVSGLASFLAYGLGMSLLLMVLTLTLAMARQGLLTSLRRALPYVQRVSGAILALMGAYLIWYGVYEIRIQRSGSSTNQGPVGLATGWSADLSERLVDLDATRTALGLALVVTVVVLLALLRADRQARHRRTD